jgi:hypothetical protein
MSGEQLSERQQKLLVAMGDGVLKVWLFQIWHEGREPILPQLETSPPSAADFSDFTALGNASYATLGSRH